MKKFNKKSVGGLLAIIVIALVTTFVTYLVNLGNTVKLNPVKSYYSLTGSLMVTLPCSSPGFNPESPISYKGLPLNYHFYDPCDGNQILFNRFVEDFGFWLLIYSGLFYSYFIKRKGNTETKA